MNSFRKDTRSINAICTHTYAQCTHTYAQQTYSKKIFLILLIYDFII